MLWVLVYDVYPEWRNRVHVMVGVCVSVLSEANVSRAWGVLIPSKSTENEFHYVFLMVSFFSVVVFIIFYKCGIWVFLGC